MDTFILVSQIFEFGFGGKRLRSAGLRYRNQLEI